MVRIYGIRTVSRTRRQRHSSSSDAASAVLALSRAGSPSLPGSSSTSPVAERRTAAAPSPLSHSVDLGAAAPPEVPEQPLHRTSSLLEGSFTRLRVSEAAGGAPGLKPAAQPHRHKSTTEFDTQAVDAAAAAAASGTRRPVSATSGLRRTLSPEPAHESDAENGGRPGKGAYFVHPAPTESVEAALLRGPGRRAKGQGVTTVFKQRLDSDHSMHKVLLRATPRTLEELTAMVGCGVVGVGRRTGVGAG